MALVPGQLYMPAFLVGEDLTYAVAYAAARLPDGSWQDRGSTLNLQRTLESVRLEEQVELQDIRPVNRRVLNNIITGRGMGCTLVEILKADTNFFNVLPQLWLAANYYRIIIARGWEYYDMNVVTGGIRDGITDYGKNTVELVTHLIDIGYPGNPQYGFQNSAPPVNV